MTIRNVVSSLFRGISSGAVPDPWEGSRGTYVGKIRGQLEKIAETLSRSSINPYFARYIPRLESTEVYSNGHGTLFRVKGYGHWNTLENLVVSHKGPLSWFVEATIKNCLLTYTLDGVKLEFNIEE